MTTTLWFIRHGETDWNSASRIQGSTDIALNAKGRLQAARVANRFKDASLDVVYSSPLARAVDTALPLVQSKSLTLQKDQNFAERHFGDFQGFTLQEIKARDAKAYELWQSRNLEFAPKGGESILQFHGRVQNALTDLLSKHQGKQIAVFTHGGVLDMLYRIANEVQLQKPRAWEIPNAGVQHLHAKGLDAKIEVLSWADVSHLMGLDAADEIDRS